MSVTESKVWINHTQMCLLFDFFKNNATVQMCREKITSTLLSGGLDITRKGISPSNDFRWVIEKYWLSFLSDLCDSFYMFGFCVWSIKEVRVSLPSKRGLRLGKNKNGIAPTQTLRIPYVMPFGTYKVQLRFQKDGYVTYHLYSMLNMFSEQNEDKTLKILMTNTHKPTIEGHIRSPVLPLIRGYNFLNKMKECALPTEHIRSQPPLLCETKPNQTSNTDAVALEMFADSDMYETQQEASYAKNRLQMCAFARQKNMAAALNGKRPKDEDVEIDEYTGRLRKKQKQKEIWEESVFVLPEGMTMSRPLHADARSDLVQLIDKHNDLVCSVMGVPKTLLLDIDEAGGGMGGTSGGTMDLTYRLYMRAIESLAMKLKPYMEEVYFEVYGETADVNFPFLPMPVMILHSTFLQRPCWSGAHCRALLCQTMTG